MITLAVQSLIISNVMALNYQFQNFNINSPHYKMLEQKSSNLGQIVLEQEKIPRIYDEIINHFEKYHQQYAQRQIDDILNSNRNGLYGGLNHLGLNIIKPFGRFKVELRRQLAPDLFDNQRWIVTDTLDIIIEAEKLMGELGREGLIEITEKQLALFSGLKFVRQFKYVHFSNSYIDGLVLNLNKVFSSIHYYQEQEFLSMAPNEFISRQDFFEMAGGGHFQTPLPYSLGLRTGGLAKISRLSQTEIESIPPTNSHSSSSRGERIILRRKTVKSHSFGVRIDIMADFFNLIQWSFFNSEYSYKFDRSFESSLGLTENELIESGNDETLQREIGHFLKGQKIDEKVLNPYRISEKESESLSKKSKYSLFFYGIQKQQETEQVNHIQNGVITRSWSHRYEVNKFIENFWTKMANVLLRSIFQVQSLIKKSEVETRAFKMTYRNEENLLESKKDLNLKDQNDSFFMSFQFDFFKGQTYKKRAIKKINKVFDRFSRLNKEIRKQFNKKILKGHFRLSHQLVVNQGGLRQFLSLSNKEAYQVFNGICERPTKKRFFFRRFCKRSLKRKYDYFINDLLTEDIKSETVKKCRRYSKKKGKRSFFRRYRLYRSCLRLAHLKLSHRKDINEIPLHRLKGLMQVLSKEIEHVSDYRLVFGVDNTSQGGSLQFYQKGQIPFFHHF
jgi:hypothetical protein